MKHPKSLTREQYLKQFSRAVRWRLPPQESEDAIADYRELIFQEERDESKLVEELGEPVQAAHLLTDVKSYRRWLAVFAVLAYGLFLLAKWDFTGHSSIYLSSHDQWWYPVWVMAVGLPLSLYWFRRHGQKNGLLPRWLIPVLAVALMAGAAVMVWAWHVMAPEFLERVAAEPTRSQLLKQVWLLGDLLMFGGAGSALAALAGLVLARCRDRRWLALYILCLTVGAILGFIIFVIHAMDMTFGAPELMRTYVFSHILPVAEAGGGYLPRGRRGD